LYGVTKLTGEHIVDNLKIPTVIIRPFTVYGLNGRGDQVFYKWLNQYKAGKPITVYGNGSSLRGYTYVYDIVNAIETLVEMPWTWKHEDFNLGGKEVLSLGSIIDIFKKIFLISGLQHSQNNKAMYIKTTLIFQKRKRNSIFIY